MADAGVTGLVAKLGELAAAEAEATALLRVDAEIRSLRRKLAYLQALVRGADRQRRGRASELLLLWLRETREVAFEVEDAVDEFHLRVEAFHLRANWRRGWWHRAANLVQGLVTQVPGSASSVYVHESHPRIGVAGSGVASGRHRAEEAASGAVGSGEEFRGAVGCGRIRGGGAWVRIWGRRSSGAAAAAAGSEEAGERAESEVSGEEGGAREWRGGKGGGSTS